MSDVYRVDNLFYHQLGTVIMSSNYTPKFNPGDIIGIKGWVGYYTVVGTAKLNDLVEPKADWWISGDNTRLNEEVYLLLRNNVMIHKIYKDGNEAYARVRWIDTIAFKIKESKIVRDLYGA